MPPPLRGGSPIAGVRCWLSSFWLLACSLSLLLPWAPPAGAANFLNAADMRAYVEQKVQAHARLVERTIVANAGGASTAACNYTLSCDQNRTQSQRWATCAYDVRFTNPATRTCSRRDWDATNKNLLGQPVTGRTVFGTKSQCKGWPAVLSTQKGFERNTKFTDEFYTETGCLRANVTSECTTGFEHYGVNMPDGVEVDRREVCATNVLVKDDPSSSFQTVAAEREQVTWSFLGTQQKGMFRNWPLIYQCRTENQCSGCSDPRFRGWYAGAASGPKDVLIIVDRSGSMGKASSASGSSRFVVTLGALNWIINTLSWADYATVVTFATSADVYGDTEDEQVLMPMTVENRVRLKNYIKSKDAFGGTDIGGAFDKAFEVLKRSRARNRTTSCQTVLLFMSDGINVGDPYSSWRSKVEQFADLDPARPPYIFTYHIHTDPTPSGAASSSGGSSGSTLTKEAVLAMPAAEREQALATNLLRAGLSCKNSGVYFNVDSENSKVKMASYFTYLAQSIVPKDADSAATVRWAERYEDGQGLGQNSAACAPIYNRTVNPPGLFGVMCTAMPTNTSEAWADWNVTWADIRRAAESCPAADVLSSDALESLRAQIGPEAACTGEEVIEISADTSGLSGGAIAGIVVGVAVVVALLALAAAWRHRRRQSRRGRQNRGGRGRLCCCDADTFDSQSWRIRKDGSIVDMTTGLEVDRKSGRGFQMNPLHREEKSPHHERSKSIAAGVGVGGTAKSQQQQQQQRRRRQQGNKNKNNNDERLHIDVDAPPPQSLNSKRLKARSSSQTARNLKWKLRKRWLKTELPVVLVLASLIGGVLLVTLYCYQAGKTSMNYEILNLLIMTTKNAVDLFSDTIDAPIMANNYTSLAIRRGEVDSAALLRGEVDGAIDYFENFLGIFSQVTNQYIASVDDLGRVTMVYCEAAVAAAGAVEGGRNVSCAASSAETVDADGKRCFCWNYRPLKDRPAGRETWYCEDGTPERRLLSPAETLGALDCSYNPKVRKWYVNAVSEGLGTVTWTDVYRDAATDDLMMTSAVQRRDPANPGGAAFHVIASDLSLSGLAVALEKTRNTTFVSHHGNATAAADNGCDAQASGDERVEILFALNDLTVIASTNQTKMRQIKADAGDVPTDAGPGGRALVEARRKMLEDAEERYCNLQPALPRDDYDAAPSHIVSAEAYGKAAFGDNGYLLIVIPWEYYFQYTLHLLAFSVSFTIFAVVLVALVSVWLHRRVLRERRLRAVKHNVEHRPISQEVRALLEQVTSTTNSDGVATPGLGDSPGGASPHWGGRRARRTSSAGSMRRGSFVGGGGSGAGTDKAAANQGMPSMLEGLSSKQRTHMLHILKEAGDANADTKFKLNDFIKLLVAGCTLLLLIGNFLVWNSVNQTEIDRVVGSTVTQIKLQARLQLERIFNYPLQVQQLARVAAVRGYLDFNVAPRPADGTPALAERAARAARFDIFLSDVQEVFASRLVFDRVYFGYDGGRHGYFNGVERNDGQQPYGFAGMLMDPISHASIVATKNDGLGRQTVGLQPVPGVARDEAPGFIRPPLQRNDSDVLYVTEYDPRARPWFKWQHEHHQRLGGVAAAVSSSSSSSSSSSGGTAISRAKEMSGWGSPYTYASSPVVGVTATDGFYLEELNRTMVGRLAPGEAYTMTTTGATAYAPATAGFVTVGIDLQLDLISDRLKALQFFPGDTPGQQSGAAFIVDRVDGNLVASSDGPIASVTDACATPARVPAASAAGSPGGPGSSETVTFVSQQFELRYGSIAAGGGTLVPRDSTDTALTVDFETNEKQFGASGDKVFSVASELVGPSSACVEAPVGIDWLLMIALDRNKFYAYYEEKTAFSLLVALLATALSLTLVIVGLRAITDKLDVKLDSEEIEKITVDSDGHVRLRTSSSTTGSFMERRKSFSQSYYRDGPAGQEGRADADADGGKGEGGKLQRGASQLNDIASLDPSQLFVVT